MKSSSTLRVAMFIAASAFAAAQDKPTLKEEFAIFRRELNAAKSEGDIKTAIAKYTGSDDVVITDTDSASYKKVIIPGITFPGPMITDAEGNGGFAPYKYLNGTLRLPKGMAGYQFDMMHVLLVANPSDQQIALPIKEDAESVVLDSDKTVAFVIITRTMDLPDKMEDGHPQKKARVGDVFRLKKKEPNQAPEPTPTTVTPPAAQEARRP